MIRALAPGAARGHGAARRTAARVELEQIHPAGVFEGVVEGAELPLRYELEVDYGDGRHVHDRGPLRVPADARRARPAPDRRGPPRAALRAARRARARAPGRRRDGVRGVGAVGARRSASSATSTPGTAGSHPMRSLGASRHLGAVRPRRRAGRALQVRDPRRRRRAALRRPTPTRSEAELPPQTASVVFALAAPLERGDGEWLARRRTATGRWPSRSRSTRSISARGG